MAVSDLCLFLVVLDLGWSMIVAFPGHTQLVVFYVKNLGSKIKPIKIPKLEISNSGSV